jgi:superfamily I DNA and/or RNA helicase
MRSLNRMNVAFTRAKSRMVILGDIPQKTVESDTTGRSHSMLDELHKYPVTIIEAKNLKSALQIVNNALAT